MNDKILQGIEVSNTYLDTLPKNNLKNQKKYYDVLSQLKIQYSGTLDILKKEIKDRFNEYSNIEVISHEEEINQINELKNNIFWLNKYNSAYEKLGFDKILYQLNHFYKFDLDEANSNIIKCVNLFKMVGINLTPSDFNYSSYVNNYMREILNNSSDIEKIKESFEKNYWQSPNLLVHIELNMKYLYYKNQNIFEKYVSVKKIGVSRKYNNILETYKNFKYTYDNNLSHNLSLGLNKFLSKELNISDYSDSKIEKVYSFFKPDYTKEDNISEEINKLYYSTLEYKNYKYFEYLIEDMKEQFNNKQDQKKIIKNLLKSINKKEKLVHKYTNKTNKKERINTKILLLLQELEDLYEELNEANFKDVIFKNLNENSSVKDALSIACSYYFYIRKCMKKAGKELLCDEEQELLKEFLMSPYNNLIMNIAITENQDLALIISDKYLLSKLNITKDSLLDENIMEEIINNAKKIMVYDNIVSKLTYDKIKFLDQTIDMFKGENLLQSKN